MYNKSVILEGIEAVVSLCLSVLLACDQSHLVCYLREYLGGEAAIYESASEASRREEWGCIL